jgi:hypothetical protein
MSYYTVLPFSYTQSLDSAIFFASHHYKNIFLEKRNNYGKVVQCLNLSLFLFLFLVPELKKANTF